MAKRKKTGGRTKGTPNKATAQLRAYAQQFDREAINELRKMMKRASAVDVARVMAARTILEYGHGKPPQAITGPDGEALPVPHAVTFVIQKAAGAETRD